MLTQRTELSAGLTRMRPQQPERGCNFHRTTFGVDFKTYISFVWLNWHRFVFTSILDHKLRESISKFHHFSFRWNAILQWQKMPSSLWVNMIDFENDCWFLEPIWNVWYTEFRFKWCALAQALKCSRKNKEEDPRCPMMMIKWCRMARRQLQVFSSTIHYMRRHWHTQHTLAWHRYDSAEMPKPPSRTTLKCLPMHALNSGDDTYETYQTRLTEWKCLRYTCLCTHGAWENPRHIILTSI